MDARSRRFLIVVVQVRMDGDTKTGHEMSIQIQVHLALAPFHVAKETQNIPPIDKKQRNRRE